MNNKIPYDFTHISTSLIAFIADLEKKIQFVYPKIPVLLQNIDDSFVFFKKYAKTELEELYNKTPRVVIDVQDVQGQMEFNTTQFLKMKYDFEGETYNSQFRRVSTGIIIETNFVCSNYFKSLAYWEFILTLLSVDNVFTYNHFGNTYQGSYLLQNTPSIEKGQLNNATSEPKNSVVKLNIELNIQPAMLNLQTITKDTDSSFLIDTDVIDIIGDGSGSDYSVSENGIINSGINSTQNLNDIGLSPEEEKKLLSNRKRVKTTNNIFLIESKLHNDEKLTYKTSLKTDVFEDINKTEENE